jgi:RNA polymerase sigma-70 factor, ECF subfamily
MPWYAAVVSADDAHDDAATDGDLVQAICAGGTSARNAEALLCARYAPRVRLYGLRHLRDEQRARDLVQSVLIGVLQAARAGRVQDLDKVDRFVLGTCRNTMLRMRELDARTVPVPDEELLAVAIEPPESLDLGRLIHCVSLLEERARQVTLLSFQQERSADEIAGALGMSEGNVRVVRHRALLALRRCLDDTGTARQVHAS